MIKFTNGSFLAVFICALKIRNKARESIRAGATPPHSSPSLVGVNLQDVLISYLNSRGKKFFRMIKENNFSYHHNGELENFWVRV